MATSIFTMLDTQHEGELPIQELIAACMRLKGSATSLDMAVLMYENRRASKELKKLCRLVQQKMVAVERGQKLLHTQISTHSGSASCELDELEYHMQEADDPPCPRSALSKEEDALGIHMRLERSI